MILLKNDLVKRLLLGAFFVWFTILSFADEDAAKIKQVAVASAHPLATEAGLAILKKGGNAFDAAVTISAVLAVVEPYSSGLGGGGFWLLHQNDGINIMVDGREKAPLKAHKDMYLDKDGNIIADLSINGALAAGIPGVPAALDHIAKKYGSLPLSELLEPAIKIAKQGFAVDRVYLQLARFRQKVLKQFPASNNIFLSKGEVPVPGSLIKQPDLAKTLTALAEKGRDGFYQGEIAQKLVQSVQKAGGIWIKEDLQQYQIKEREPLVGKYHDMEIVSVAPPSSGGTTLISMLNMLTDFDLKNQSRIKRIHLITEAMRRAYRDRAEYLGDSDFVNVPVTRLINPYYGKGLASTILMDKATPSSQLRPVQVNNEGYHTTHFSVIDAQGNYVAATLSINYPFGSGMVAEGTGVLLNDEMDDFVSKAGEPNVYGLVGADANSIEPGKRMLSSMTPTFLKKGDKLAIIGTPGGSRIITMVLLGALAFDEGKTAKEIVALPRYHHQYLPDRIQYEKKAFSLDDQLELQWLGHNLKRLDYPYGNMQLIIQDEKKHTIEAASDPRGVGMAKVINLP